MTEEAVRKSIDDDADDDDDDDDEEDDDAAASDYDFCYTVNLTSLFWDHWLCSPTLRTAKKLKIIGLQICCRSNWLSG